MTHYQAQQLELDIENPHTDYEALAMAADMEARARSANVTSIARDRDWGDALPKSVSVGALTNCASTTTASALANHILPGYYGAGTVEAVSTSPKQPVAEDGLTPTDFVIWLNGVIDIEADEPPTPEQWARVRKHLTSQVAGIARHRLGGVYKAFTKA